MAVTTTPVGAPTSYAWTEDTAAIAAFTNSTNVRNGSCTLHAAIVYNAVATTNVGDAYLKIYDSNGSGLVVGTTEPDFIVRLDTKTAAGVSGFWCHEGVLLSNGLSYIVCDTAGKATGTVMDQTVTVHFVTS